MDVTKKYTLSREIEANKEIQGTRISHKMSVCMSILFVLAIISVPVVQLFREGMPKSLTDDELRTSCYMENALTSHYQQLLTGMLHSGNEKAIMGCEDGWLFYTPDVEHLLRPIQQQSVSCILDMKQQLEARGIRLVLLPTPLKPMLCARQLSHDFEPGQLLIHPAYAAWVSELQRHGVIIADPTKALQELNVAKPAFLRTDTHWTPEGMQVAVAQLAKELQANGLIGQSAQYSSIDSIVSQRGDIYTMLRLAEEIDWIPQEDVVTKTVLDAAGSFHSRQRNAEILLLGDSFTNIYSVANMGWGRASGLAEQLSLLMQCPIDVISRNDGGSYATRQMLHEDMAKGNDRLAGKKVVVWQFAMRELTTGNWEPMKFEVGKVNEELQYLDIVEEEKLTVEATVVEVAAVPHPSTVTYEEHVVALHLTDIEGHPGKEALAYILAMEDRKLLPAANIRPGDRISVTLENWSAHEAEEGAFNRSELESDITFLAVPAWAVLNNIKQ